MECTVSLIFKKKIGGFALLQNLIQILAWRLISWLLIVAPVDKTVYQDVYDTY